jgi:hypothetical protein
MNASGRLPLNGDGSRIRCRRGPPSTPLICAVANMANAGTVRSIDALAGERREALPKKASPAASLRGALHPPNLPGGRGNRDAQGARVTRLCQKIDRREESLPMS